MGHHHAQQRRLRKHHSRENMQDIYRKIWGRPPESCPKCKYEATEYYDPFFFAPLRTLAGKRRIQCPSCGFIWRPSRSRKSIFDSFMQQ